MGLDRAAYEAVRRWRFQPATKNGQPVPVMINVEVNFRPEVVGMDLPLFPGAEAKASPPQFPGVDLSKYPNIERWLNNMKTLKSWPKINEAFYGLVEALKAQPFLVI